jgi:hypothetical protein
MPSLKGEGVVAVGSDADQRDVNLSAGLDHRHDRLADHRSMIPKKPAPD